MKTKMKVIDIIKKADIETVAKIIGGVIVMHTDGISAKAAMKNEYPATLKFLQSDMEIDYKPTNADRIRAMSDEELAEFFSERDKIPNRYKCKEIEDWIKWLQSEA